MTSLSIDHTFDNLTRRAKLWKQATEQAHRHKMHMIASTIDFLLRGTWHVWRNRRYLTIYKLINMAVVNLQQKLRSERLYGMPYSVKIESTNICNTKCQLCPTGIGMPGRKKGKMDFAKFRGLVDQYRRFLYQLDLSMWGDPLIVPDIYKMIRYAHDQRILTYLSSNLHAFKPDKGHAEQLVKCGLNMMTCSLHGATQQTYETYQPGKTLDDSIAKIRAIVEAKRRLNSSTPEIQLNFVVTRYNEHEIEAFEKLATELEADAVFSCPSLNIRFIESDAGDAATVRQARQKMIDRIKTHMEKWLPHNQAFVIPPYRELLKQLEEGDWAGERYNGNKTMNCTWPWTQTVINWDGTVVTCCGGWKTEEEVGNVFEQPLRKIWNNQSYRMSRRSFKKPVDDEDGYNNPCRTCPGFLP